MKKNIGTTDRIFRIVLGLAIAILGIYYQSWWGLIAIMPLGTALVGSCGLYSLIGINTCKTDLKDSTQK